MTSPPAPAGSKSKSKFKLVSTTQAEEDAFDIVAQRNLPKPCGVVASIAYLVKGALGAGILTSHVAYMKAGILVAIPLTVLLGMYITYCLHVLVMNAQIMSKRTGVPSMTYSDVGEAALACHPNPKISRWSKTLRYTIDFVICLDLFGSCATYQLIIAKTIKQLVENQLETSIAPKIEGYPGLRVYLACIIIPCILICLIRHMKWLAPFSIVANFFIVVCICVTIYYASKNNPRFENLVWWQSFEGTFQFVGMIVFSMSCAGIVIPIENNMGNPKKFTLVLVTGMSIVISCISITSFFGYVAYLKKCDSPITVNFPMEILPKILKGLIFIMIYVTHAINFWAPFQLVFHYLSKLHKPEKVVMWEFIYRAIIVVMISLIAITFPAIAALMGFLGCFCLSNMAFIWPNLFELLVVSHRPGFGKYKWRLWKSLFLILIGIFLFACGTVVSIKELVRTF